MQRGRRRGWRGGGETAAEALSRHLSCPSRGALFVTLTTAVHANLPCVSKSQPGPLLLLDDGRSRIAVPPGPGTHGRFFCSPLVPGRDNAATVLHLRIASLTSASRGWTSLRSAVSGSGATAAWSGGGQLPLRCESISLSVSRWRRRLYQSQLALRCQRTTLSVRRWPRWSIPSDPCHLVHAKVKMLYHLQRRTTPDTDATCDIVRGMRMCPTCVAVCCAWQVCTWHVHAHVRMAP